MTKIKTNPVKRVTNTNVQKDSPFRHLPYISDRIADVIVDLVDDSYILLPDDGINVPPGPGMPMLTIEELAMLYAREESLKDIIKDPQVVIKITGNAYANERITAMVRGRPPVGDPDMEYWITSEPMEYFEEDDTSLIVVPTKKIRQFFENTGYVEMLKEAEEAIRKTGFKMGAGLDSIAMGRLQYGDPDSDDDYFHWHGSDEHEKDDDICF